MVSAEIIITTIDKETVNYFYMFLIAGGLYLFSMVALLLRINKGLKQKKHIKKLEGIIHELKTK